MKCILFVSLFFVGIMSINAESKLTSIYDIPVIRIDGSTETMASYKGKVLLIVNTASKCGFTKQYKGLEVLHEELADKGLVVMGFPCNQFGAQEPGEEKEIMKFCQLNYGVTFPLFSKIDVNGDHAHPLFQLLKEQAPGILGTEAIKWNFTKFLVDKNGKVVERFGSRTTPAEIKEKIVGLLAK